MKKIIQNLMKDIQEMVDFYPTPLKMIYNKLQKKFSLENKVLTIIK